MSSILTIRPNEEMKKKIKLLAKQRGLSVNALVIQILWDYIQKND